MKRCLTSGNYKKEIETTMRTYFCSQQRRNTHWIPPPPLRPPPGTMEKLDELQEPMTLTTLNRRPGQWVPIKNRKQVRWALQLPRHCKESFQAVLQGRGTQAEPEGLPELRKRSWESRRQGVKSLRAENQRGERRDRTAQTENCRYLLSVSLAPPVRTHPRVWANYPRPSKDTLERTSRSSPQRTHRPGTIPVPISQRGTPHVDYSRGLLE